jgi:hypothetical protein
MAKKKRKIFAQPIKGEIREKDKIPILIEMEKYIRKVLKKDLLFAILTGSSIYKIRKNHDIDILVVVKDSLKSKDFFIKKFQLIEKIFIATKKYKFKFDFYFPIEIIPESVFKTQITLNFLKRQEILAHTAPKNTLIDFNHFALCPIWSSMLLFSKFWLGDKHVYNKYYNRIKKIMLKFYQWKTKNKSLKFIARYYW